MNAPAATTRLQIAAMVALLFVLQVALYHRSFGVKPASDDFPIIHETVRGNEQGPGIFFRQSMSDMHHRPFKSLTIWCAGRISTEHRDFWIRVLHFSAMAGYAAVLGLWISRLNCSPAACFIATIVMLIHPTLPQALSSIDGIDGIASSALLWLGAYLVLVWRDRMALALPAACVCFLLAAGWKEYSFAMVPLATWTLICFSTRHRWRNAAILFAGLCGVFLLILLARQFAIPSGYGSIRGTDYVALNPIQWVKNAVIITTGLLFAGNSIWVYVHESPIVLGIVGVCILMTGAMIAVGVIQSFRDSDPEPSRRWVIFLLGSFVAASFPVNLIIHMSEMYLVPLLLPLALLCGIAADGWRRSSRPMRGAACAIAIAALISSALAVHAKIEGLRDVGQRAENQVMQILAMLPPDAHDLKVAVLFDLNELPPRRTFAVYRMGDEVLVVHEMALDCFVPGRNLKLGSYPIGDPAYHPEQYDVILKWNYAKQHFERI